MMNRKIRILMLDAMGVTYKHGDDVKELLIPFIRGESGKVSEEVIKDNYAKASLGQTSSKEFWQSVGVDSKLEDEYLSRFKLNDNLMDFLCKAYDCFDEIICLSNDVSEWSKKLKREKFGLEKYITKWFISGDLKCRKPSPETYLKVIKKLGGIEPEEILFIDDNKNNTDAAERLGIKSLLLSGNNYEVGNSIDRLDFEIIKKRITLKRYL